jgi:hypothetical protein
MVETFRVPAAALTLWLTAVGFGRAGETVEVPDRKSEYVDRVTRGDGLMPWQDRGVSNDERIEPRWSGIS